MARVATRQRLNGFGSEVMAIAAHFGIPTRAELLRTLADGGHRFHGPTVAHWMYGRRPVDRRFPLAIAEVLPLSDEMRVSLAMAYLHGQDPVE